MANDPGCTFSASSAARISKVVKQVEAGSTTPTRGDPAATIRPIQSRFTARVTAYDSTTKGHSWTYVVRQPGGGHTDYAPVLSGTLNAFELHGGQASVNDVIELIYTGRKTDGTAGYWFTAKAGSLPAPTGLYQVLQCLTFTAGTPPTYTLGFDYVKAHPRATGTIQLTIPPTGLVSLS